MKWVILLLLFPNFSLGSVCNPGTFTDGDDCTDCDPGFFQPYENGIECFSCPEGFYQSLAKSLDCALCPSGYSQLDTGKNSCEECTEGYFSTSEGNVECSECPKGYYQENTLSDYCTACPAGFYSMFEAEDYCMECEPGKFQQNPSQESCQTCQQGKFADENKMSLCKECPIGFYQNSIPEYCNKCPQGYLAELEGRSLCDKCTLDTCGVCDGFGIQDNSCKVCPKGKYSKDSTLCIDCEFGYKSMVTKFLDGETFEEELEFFGTEQISGGNVCQACQRGEAYNSQTYECDTCPLGTFSINFICEVCPKGYYRDRPIDPELDAGADLCDKCPSGFFGGNGEECEACDVGKYQNLAGSIICHDCRFPTKSAKGYSICNEDCPEGFEVGPFDPTCLSCPAGKDGSSADNCELCPAGKVKVADYGTCLECKEGKTSNGNRTECVICHSGKYSFNGLCTDCPKGRYMPSADIAPPTINCSLTSPGGYQDEIGKMSEKKCPAGTYTDSAGLTECKECPSGKYSDVGFGYCIECRPNSGEDPIGVNDDHTACEPCPEYQATIDGECKKCPVGTQITSAKVCQNCPAGYIMDASMNQNFCEPCPIGKKTISTVECGTCPTGQIPNLAGEASSYCISETSVPECSPGTYYSDGSCLECPIGTISAAGTTVCVSCQDSEIEENNNCVKCGDGKSPNNANACVGCAVGKFGQSGICYDCARGQYQTEIGQTDCKLCEPGRTTPNVGTSLYECLACTNANDIVVDGICVTCTPGRYETDQGCQNCPGGYYKKSTDVRCIECAAGQVSSPGSKCRDCEPGTFSDEPGLAECKKCGGGITINGCETCAAGKAGDGITCEICPPGKWSIADQEECSNCGIGQYQDLAEQQSCKPCTPGRIAGSIGASVCNQCETGKFQPNERSGVCIDCLKGQFTDEIESIECKVCDPGKYTESEGSGASSDCIPCPAGTMELNGGCIECPERTYQPRTSQTSCISCPDNKLSPKASTSDSQCFSREAFVTYVFGMKSDSKVPQSYTKNCEIRPNFVMLCPGCSCDDDSRNGHWSGPICNECRRGFATQTCTAICPAYDGTHDSTMCNGNGFCWYGKFGDGLCYCGSKSQIDSTGENVVVDVRICPKGQICPGYGPNKLKATKYAPMYFIMQYRQYSVFVLMLNRYTPQRGHMWFKRFSRSKAHENTCLACTGAFNNDGLTTVGFWNKDSEYEYYKNELQTLNGFHGENCQHECALCLNGGRCHHVPHPYRFSYTILDTFRPQREIFIPQTQCICSSMVFDPENMCCPNGFQPFVHFGLKLNPDPYTRFNRMPYLTSIVNEREARYWVNRDIYLEPNVNYLTPYSEPASGQMYVSNNNGLIEVAEEDMGREFVQVPFKDHGPYNKHIYYGNPRDICRACPGLFGKGVRTNRLKIESEAEAEETWWDNAMGAAARKCNGIGVCDFYKRPEEHTVKFMGDANNYRIYERAKTCEGDATDPIGGMQNVNQIHTLLDCVQYGISVGANFIVYQEPYLGGKDEDMASYADGVMKIEMSELRAKMAAEKEIIDGRFSKGYASFVNETTGETLWTILRARNLTERDSMPIPDSDSKYTLYSLRKDVCGAYFKCDQFNEPSRLNIYKIKLGEGSDRLPDATFNRFDTCFTYTKDNQIQKFGLYLTQDYKNGEDPFLGGLCPRGHYCTEYNGIGYKEACPPGYYQPMQGITRSVTSTRCNTLLSSQTPTGCQLNEATENPLDHTDLVCIRCSRNTWAEEGAYECKDCPLGSVKKVSGIFNLQTRMLNMPTFTVGNYLPWYYTKDEKGYEESDCAIVPAGIVHIPFANSYMEYERPDFLPVMSCPYAMSSRPGTFSIGEFVNLERLIISKKTEVIDPPFIRFHRTWEVEAINWKNGSTCECAGRAILKRGQCLETMQRRGLVMKTRTGPKGCYISNARPHEKVGFFSDGDTIEYPIKHITYLCRKGEDNDNLAAVFAQSNCFRCPGNSITGAASTACTTCFANQMKVFAKEGLTKFAEGSVPTLSIGMREGQSVTDTNNIVFSPFLPAYGLNFDQNVQGFIVSYKFINNGVTKTQLTLADCYLACSAMTQSNFIAIGIQKNQYLECACAKSRCTSCPATSADFAWYEIVDAEDQSKPSDPNMAPWANAALPLCASCQPGKRTDGGCISCDPGMYTEDENAASQLQCTECDPGMYQNASASVSCIECPNGWYQEDKATQLCIQCPAGFSQLEKAGSSCKECDAGKYTVNPASFICLDCDTGQYQSDKAQTSCKVCEEGQFSDVLGITECKECPAGYKHQSPMECQKCQKGQYQAAPMQNYCVECNKGQYQDVAGAISACKHCEAGKYQDQISARACKNCPGGKTCSQASAGSNCPSNRYAPGLEWTTSCKKCAIDHEIKSDKKGCKPCRPGYTTEGRTGSTCVECPEEGWSSAPYSDNKRHWTPNIYHYKFTGSGGGWPYHRCVFGGGGWGCNGYGGERTIFTYITVRDSGNYDFTLINVRDRASLYLKRMDNGREGPLISGFTSLLFPWWKWNFFWFRNLWVSPDYNNMKVTETVYLDANIIYRVLMEWEGGVAPSLNQEVKITRNGQNPNLYFTKTRPATYHCGNPSRL